MSTRVIEIHEAVQGQNDQLAARNRALFEDAGVYVINVMSAPGSGKTEFLARTLADMAVHPSQEPMDRRNRLRIAVVVGDIATDNDAKRLGVTGVDVVQITTGGYCHLDADMVAKAIAKLDLRNLDVLIIENVGNMVCPATFDLGEHARIALISVTEGEDKPLKYPTLFQRADLVVINKIDLAEAVDYKGYVVIDNISRISPEAYILEASAKTGEGMADWYLYLQTMHEQHRKLPCYV
jgi:hydrogenase nickel incorporation protein HypB